MGNTFSGWGGACLGAASTASVTMDAAKGCTATFEASGQDSDAGPYSGLYRITRADGTDGDYVSVQSTTGAGLVATVYRADTPIRADSFVLADGGVNVASLIRWGSWDWYVGTLAGNTATLGGYVQYGQCHGSMTLVFSDTNSGTIRVAPTGPSEFAPAGSAAACAPSGAQPALKLTRQSPSVPTATHDGIYQIQPDGDYVTVQTTPSNVLVTAYRAAHPARADHFALTDGGAAKATLYVWGSWDLYIGTQAGNTVMLSGYARYGLCSSRGNITFSADGKSATISIGTNGISDLVAPGSLHPGCIPAAGPVQTMIRGD
jgi:hypothetical protein